MRTDMNTSTPHSAPAPAARAGRASGFTLAELIVAVGAVALLTVGIGQIFSSVGRLVGAGNALAETDQFARALENQMRDDFESLSLLRSQETFMVIRNRRLGDLNNSNALNGLEKATYLNAEDKDADRRDQIAPYSLGSRAVTVRLDEIMFIAATTADSATSQRIPPGMVSAGAANYVRIYYGHGLRPPVDTRFNPLQPPSNRTGNVPPRMWFGDGDFGDRAGVPNRYAPGAADAVFQQTQGRNEFAGDWLLLRQPLFLVGGLAAGYSLGAPAGAQPTEWTYSPFIRGLECVERVYAPWGIGVPMDDLNNATPSPNATSGPYARVLYHGRTDICSQGRDEVQRWLEGLDGSLVPQAEWADASAFTAGQLDDGVGKWDATIHGFPSDRVDAPLWRRQDQPVGDATLQFNHQALISAIAGCLARFQAEDDPPLVERADVLTTASGNPIVLPPRPRFQQLMDMHAVVASRVSNFEIAWTDGKTWSYNNSYDRNEDDDPTDSNSDGDYGLSDNINRGDVIWFDMDFTRYDNPNSSARDLPGADTDNRYNTQAPNPLTLPEVFPGERLVLLQTGFGYPNRYDIRRESTTGADLNDAAEYLAIFPFRKVNNAGGFAEPYPKPTRIRVRMTVHDAQFRLPGGRQYEFEFSVPLQQ